MLVRAARRKARPEALRYRPSNEPLYLPSLCTTHHASQRSHRWFAADAASQVGGPRPRRNSQDASTRPTRRALATATGYMPMDDIPFEGMGSIPLPGPSSLGYGFGRSNGLTTGEQYRSPSGPLQLGGSLAMPPQRYSKNQKGVGGSVSEIQSVFNACLQVGRLERAGVILQRMAKLEEMDPNALLSLHNQYLRAAVEQVMVNPTAASMQDLHKWYELRVRLPGVPQNIDTVAYMIKASLQAPPDKRERLVRRYMDMLDENSAARLWDAEVLTAQEINEVNHVYPKYNLILEVEEEMIDELDADPSLDQIASQSLIPNVRPTGQKGLGLKSLKKSLSLFSTLPSEGFDLSSATAKTRREVQTRLEEDAVTSAIDRWRDESTHLNKMGLNTSLQTKSLGARMWKWQEALTEYLKIEVEKVNASEEALKMTSADMERVVYGPFLRLLPPDILAAVTILSAMSALGALGADKGLPLSTAIMAIARSVEDESAFESLQKESRKQMWPNSKNRPDVKGMRRAARFRSSTAKNNFGPNSSSLDENETIKTVQNREWSLPTRAKVGAFLMSALIQVAKVPVTLTHPETGEVVTQMQPALSHSHQYKMGKKLGVIITNKSLVAQLKREPVHSLLAKHLPMLVEPDPWTDFSKGGFIAHPAKIMRIKNGDKDQRHYAEAAIGQGDMQETFKGLNVLGKTAWRINQPIFDIMLEAWNSGEGIANMPPETPKLTIPPEPEPSSDPLERRRWIREVKGVENLRSGLHSQRCFQNFQLEIARALRNEVFYFPHNIDFRGRAYPIPPYLNHMGADHCRGLLKFGEGRELGEGGLRWLKIHVANVFGFDKASLSEREAFATTNLEKIYETATNPLAGKKWWLKAEDPWQFLAACIELRNALESPDPTKFVSSLPVHQDGTCNGLQHYAALGGDIWGARQVNLEPGDRPADVYTAVADLVKASIVADAARGNEKGTFLKDKISRKVVKQTVMTNVYGVTFVGAKAQVRRQLLAAYPDLPNNDIMNAGSLAAYVATKIFTALSTMFKGAHDIQYWLGECATRISTCLTPEQMGRLELEWPRLTSTASSSVKGSGRYKPASLEELSQFKSSVIWTTPLHMPVVQPYRSTKSKTIKTNMQTISLSEPHRSDPISKRKQLQGFPPNFIHSLDATHMLLSALQCDELGLSFAAVHDSFWTHASEIDTMNTVLRDTFIRIHSEDVVGRLRDEFIARYQGAMHIASVRIDSPVVQKIKAWRESKPLTRTAKQAKNRRAPYLDELILERKRQRLLSSSDPEEIELGKSMVTPTSIFQEHASEADLSASVDLGNTGLGDISQALREDDKDGAIEDIEESENGEGENVDDFLAAGNEDEEALSHDLDSDHENEGVDTRTPFEKNMNAVQRLKVPVLQIWLPLTFPPVPQKGQFDVTRLKNSQYFFS